MNDHKHHARHLLVEVGRDLTRANTHAQHYAAWAIDYGLSVFEIAECLSITTGDVHRLLQKAAA